MLAGTDLRPTSEMSETLYQSRGSTGSGFASCRSTTRPMATPDGLVLTTLNSDRRSISSEEGSAGGGVSTRGTSGDGLGML
jgi:hypothetical protein